ncbi:MAG: stage II sporulation protein R [Firmicutes bacterium]|nr:stage II sporulation protein R [Bacillota bacterium]
MKKISMVLLMFLCIFGTAFWYSVEVQKNLSDNLLRMHIVANSDSEKDQHIKLEVRNDILKNINENSTLWQLESSAREKLRMLGADYDVRTSLERCYVPVKEYKNISLPEGYYNCVRVVLGNGKGKNWWCVAYPPLCFTEDVFGDLSENGKKELVQRLESESFDAIIKNGGVNYKFKIVEEIQKLRKKYNSECENMHRS